MLTDEQIEQILYKYTSRQDEFNLSVITVIAERLSKLADFDSLSTLSGSTTVISDIAEMNDIHKKYIKKQKKALEEDFWWIAFLLYAEALGFYDVQLSIRENTEVYNAVVKAIKEAQTKLEEVVKYPVFVIRDLKNPAILKAYNFEKTYRSVITEAFNYRNVSKELQSIALKRTEMQLFDSGVHYMIDNSSDSAKDAKNANLAVRFNVLDSMKNLINTMQDIMGNQFGADGLELSAHIFPAPDHAPAQGHQFTFEEVEKMQNGEDFKDVTGREYVGFVRNIGEWNCRHYFMQIKLGAKPEHSQKELDKILEENERGYTDENGKHRTLYECTQVQRRYEREIRYAKQKYLYGKALNDTSIMSAARNRVGKLTTQYKQFSKNCNIPAQLERIRVNGYQ
jgi:hypothetical protein